MWQLHRLERLVRALVRTPGTASRALCRWRPFNVSTFGLVTALRQHGVEYRTILDAGANVGQFARAAVELYPAATVIAFEPNPTAARQFRRNLESHPRVRLLETAVGERDGSITFYPSTFDHGQVSSCVASYAAMMAAAVGCAQAPIEVPIGRLDSLIDIAELRTPVLLKLDLQGYELPALMGAARLLRRCEHVLSEVNFANNGEDFEALRHHLAASGFTFAQPLDFLAVTGQYVEMDALFKRTMGQGATQDTPPRHRTTHGYPTPVTPRESD